MTVPDFETIMLPLLSKLGDGDEHTLRELIDSLSLEFKLSESDRKRLLPSGRQPAFDNRVGWARVYLNKAGLLESTGRARFRITQRGSSVLQGKPVGIDKEFLRQFREFKEFEKAVSPQPKAIKAQDDAIRTPDETLEKTYKNLREELAQDLLERIRKSPPWFFEQLVIDLLLAMGYGGSREDVVQAMGHTGDEGIDGIIKEDKLGLDIVCVQAKRWIPNVGRDKVSEFGGSLDTKKASKGVMLTTSRFTDEAKDYVSRSTKQIVLVDGHRLADLMIDHDVGVSTVHTYTIKRVDEDYFTGE